MHYTQGRSHFTQSYFEWSANKGIRTYWGQILRCFLKEMVNIVQKKDLSSTTFEGTGFKKGFRLIQNMVISENTRLSFLIQLMMADAKSIIWETHQNNSRTL